ERRTSDLAGSSADRVLGEELVEVLSRADEAVVREARDVRPVRLQAHAATDDAQPLVADPALLLRRGNAEGEQRAGRAGGEPAAADLLSGEGGPLEEDDVHPVGGQGGRTRGAAGTGSADDDVRRVVRRSGCTARGGLGHLACLACEGIHELASV